VSFQQHSRKFMGIFLRMGTIVLGILSEAKPAASGRTAIRGAAQKRNAAASARMRGPPCGSCRERRLAGCVPVEHREHQQRRGEHHERGESDQAVAPAAIPAAAVATAKCAVSITAAQTGPHAALKSTSNDAIFVPSA
jgi:hypothetical protein